MFNKYSDYISHFSNDLNANDYWYDIAILHASELLDSFTEQDWILLENSFLDRSNGWLARFCESVDNTTNKKVLPILLVLVTCDEKEISFKALDALNSLPLPISELLAISDKIKKAIQKIKMKAGVVDRVVLNALEEKLNITNKNGPALKKHLPSKGGAK